MQIIDEMLAPVEAPPPSVPITIAAAVPRPVFDVIPPTKRNGKWFNRALSETLRPAAVEPTGESDEDYKAKCHVDADIIAETMLAGWSVERIEGGPLERLPSDVDLYKTYLHRLIDAEQGLDAFMLFRSAIHKAADAKQATAIDPTEAAGNSSAV